MMAGETIGPYRIVGKLGKGGMGEVYRAHDTKLGREVALKILPDSFARDPDRLARFTREAQVLASLNHPNIAAIHGLEDSSSTLALVLELVEGPTLADRIAEGPIGLEEALAMARQIADALQAAHDRGIVHRDLKPANIKLRPDGTVKVLDFGLAKALAVDGPAAAQVAVTNSPTLTSPVGMTAMGMSLGTAAYMAPEQARGKMVDKRADIWAFGCVLFEMLSGAHAFEDEDVSLTLSKVLQKDPDFAALPAGIPSRVIQVIRTCLRKDPRQRFHDIADVRLALDGAFRHTGGTGHDRRGARFSVANGARRHGGERFRRPRVRACRLVVVPTCPCAAGCRHASRLRLAGRRSDAEPRTLCDRGLS
jgi:serine/threonine protein kinase